jgi:cytoskeletal protein CcmA (bactofilin family)
MFSKGNSRTTSSSTMVQNEPPRTTTRTSSTPSIISADLHVVGDLMSNGDIQVDGEVEGDIQSRTVTIGATAHVRGSVSAETVRVCGAVTGQIRGNTVSLDRTARVSGDILHASLAIEPGAFLEGHCRRIESVTADTTVTPLIEHDRGHGSESVPAAANL